MDKTLTLKLRNPNDEQREMINSNECIYAQWNEPDGQSFAVDAEPLWDDPKYIRAHIDAKDARIAELERHLHQARAKVDEECRLNAMGQERELKLRARVTELEARERELEQTIRLSDYEIRRLMSLVVEAAAERDAARAECENLRYLYHDRDERWMETQSKLNQVEAQAARMRETNSGGLVQGLVKALETIRGLAMMSARPPGSYTARIMDACTEALDAWKRDTAGSV